jgi:undecaprenyl-diphosphatase
MDSADAIKTVVMGVVEGITEFLPVSSTGHLIVTGELIGFEAGPARKEFRDLFEVVIQLGAILAIVVLYRARLLQLARDLLRGDAAARGFLVNLLLAFLPAAVVGLALNKYVEKYLMNSATVAAALAVGGLAIILIERRHPQPRHSDLERLPARTALAIGFCQCLSVVLPGTSRAAATILGGMLLGVERKVATDFSFILAIPVMFAASGYKLWKDREVLAANHDHIAVLALGFVVSFVVAWAAVAWLLRYIANHTFTAFGWYRIGAGLVIAALLVAGLISFKD